MKFSIIRKTWFHVQDIWKNGEFSKWLLSPLDQKFFEQLVSKAFENRKRSGCVDRQQVRSIHRNLFFFRLTLLIFKQWWQLWMKTATMKQRCRVNFVDVNSMGKLIYNRCTCKLIIKITAAYAHAHEQLRLCFYVCHFVVLDIHLWVLYYNDNLPQARWTLTNAPWAWGE